MIKNISLNSIGKFKAISFDLSSGVNIITGPNRAGKSTLKNAIQFSLTGDCSDRDKKDLISTIELGKPEIASVIDFKGEHKIVRKLEPASITYDGIKKAVSRKKDIDALEAEGFNKYVLTMLCDNYNFISLSPEIQEKILFNYFSGDTAIDLSEFNLKPEELTEFYGMTSSTIPLFYKKFYDERTAQKHTLTTIKTAIQNNESTIKELGKTSHSFDALKKQRNELQASFVITQSVPNNFFVQLSERNEKLKDVIRETYISEFKPRIDAINAKGLENKNIIDKCSKFAGKCPLSTDITCNSGDSISAYIESLKEENTKLRGEINALVALDEEAARKFNIDREEKIKQATIAVKLAQDELDKATKANDEQRLSAEAENINIKDKIQEIDLLLINFSKMEQLQKEIEKLENEEVIVNKRIDALERYLELTGKSENGIVAKSVGSNIGSFFNAVNEQAKEFGFVFEKDESKTEFGILVNKKTVNMLSSSEKIIASIAIQVAIAKISGYNIVMVDDIEVMEAKYIMDLVEKLNYSKVQAIIVGHSLPSSMFAPDTVNVIQL